ncbi:MAG: hypothetical protein H0X30_35985 [Anaerolineae bacterium]|nr:hypothetical protein [Anaerolineae bacterium]
MNSLMNAKPSAIVTEFGFTTFYFDVRPNSLRRLPPYSEFKLVYSASDTQGWESLSYRVSHDKKGYCVIDRQALMPHEIEYFEGLLQNTNA